MLSPGRVIFRLTLPRVKNAMILNSAVGFELPRSEETKGNRLARESVLAQLPSEAAV
jgi:hypothetical protein